MRIFSTSDQWQDNQLTLTRDHARHLRTIRLKKGDEIDIIFSDNASYIRLRVDTVNTTTLRGEILYQGQIPTPPIPEIIVAQCCPKGDKMGEILRACTEIGVTQFFPLTSIRTLSVPPEIGSRKWLRWTTILESAAEQSRRFQIPKLHPPQSLSDFLKIQNQPPRWILWEGPATTSLKSALTTYQPPTPITIVVGPEGGLCESEITKLQPQDQIITVGPTILRVEHAAFYAAAGIQTSLHS